MRLDSVGDGLSNGARFIARRSTELALWIISAIILSACAVTDPSIILASVRDDPSFLEERLAKGDYVNVGASAHSSPLIWAARAGRVRNVKMLIEKGAIVNTYSGHTALVEAAAYGHNDVVNLLLDHGVDIEYSLYEHVTPLMIAARNDRRDVVKTLIARGADINNALYGPAALVWASIDGQTPLIWASMQNNVEVVKILIEAGADVNMRDNKGNTALSMARMCGNNEVAQVLLDAGAVE